MFIQTCSSQADCVRIPSNVSLELGALLEPLSVAIHALRRSTLAPSSTVLIFGAGAVGLLCAAMCKVAGASKIIIADIQAERVEFAVQNGFAHESVVVPMKRFEEISDKLAFAKEVAEMVKTKDGREVDAVFECTGVESCLQAAIYVCYLSPSHKSRSDRKIVNTSWWQNHAHRHGIANPNPPYLGGSTEGDRSRRCIPICQYLRRGHQISIQ